MVLTRGGRWAIMMTAALVLPVLAGCAGGQTAARAPDPRPSATALPSPTGSPAVPDIPRSSADVDALDIADTVAPVRIAIPELAIDMTVDPEGVDADGAMALPEDAATAGWYRFGPGLHADRGATVIAAHIDSRHDGIGPFSRLGNASLGSVITVVGSDGSSVDYQVSDVRSVGKIAAPMAEVFDRSGSPRLTLVTCGGIFDSSTGHYLDNIIVTATPSA